MNKFSKILLFLTIFYLIIIFPAVGFAKPCPGNTSVDCPVTGINDVMNILTKIVNVLYTAFFIVAIGFVILAAFSYLTGGDDPEKIKSANHKIIYAAISIAVALISVGANEIIKNFIK